MAIIWEKIKYADGSVYVGDVKDGSPLGKGTLKYADGRYYKTKFENGKPVFE